jgi:hypothetical protein
MTEENLDTQAWKAGYSSVPAFLRAQKKAKKLADWQARNDENSTATSERASRLPAHLDRPYCGSYTQRALQPEEQTEAKDSQATRIPASIDEKAAKDAYEWYFYPHNLSDDRKRWAVKFGIALGFCIQGEAWSTLDQTRKDLILNILNSEEAAKRFS